MELVHCTSYSYQLRSLSSIAVLHRHPYMTRLLYSSQFTTKAAIDKSQAAQPPADQVLPSTRHRSPLRKMSVPPLVPAQFPEWSDSGVGVGGGGGVIGRGGGARRPHMTYHRGPVLKSVRQLNANRPAAPSPGPGRALSSPVTSF